MPANNKNNGEGEESRDLKWNEWFKVKVAVIKNVEFTGNEIESD